MEKQFVENGRFTNFWFVRSRNWLVIDESQIPNSNSALYHTSTLFYNLLDPRRLMKFTFSLKTREGTTYRFASWEPLPPSCRLPWRVHIFLTSICLPLGQLFEAYLRGQPHPRFLTTCIWLILTWTSLGLVMMLDP